MIDETTGRNEGDLMSRRQALALAAGSAAVFLGTETAGAEPRAPDEARRFDVVIVGGGPAGLSAALVLGRACRHVLVCDSGPGRNAPAAGVHGFFSRDGTPPSELRRIGREQLKPYAVEMRDASATDARKVEGGFEVTLDGADRVACRKLILATGLTDVLPEIPGLKEFWGTGVILCPYCHGWEFRGRPWSFMAPPEHVVESATLLLGWTKELTLLTDGPAALSPEDRAWLGKRSIEVVEGRIERLEGADGKLAAVRLKGGETRDCSVLKIQGTSRQRSNLPEKLGCELVKEGPTAGMIKADPTGATGVEGLYVIGDASAGAPNVALAVADGSMAAGTANRAMLIEDARDAR